MSQWNAVTFACMCKRHIKLTQAQQELFFPNMRFFWEHNCRIRMLQILPSGIWCKTNLSSHLPFPCYQVPKPLQGIMTFGLFVKSFLRGLKWTWESPPQKPSASFQPSQSSFSIFLFLMGLVYLHSFNFFQLYCLKIICLIPAPKTIDGINLLLLPQILKHFGEHWSSLVKMLQIMEVMELYRLTW